MKRAIFVVLACACFIGGRMGYRYVTALPGTIQETAVSWWRGKPKVPTTALAHKLLSELAVHDNWYVNGSSLYHNPDGKLSIHFSFMNTTACKAEVYMAGARLDSFQGDDLELIKEAAIPVHRELTERLAAKTNAEVYKVLEKPTAGD